jgi:hypothetical protein
VCHVADEHHNSSSIQAAPAEYLLYLRIHCKNVTLVWKIFLCIKNKNKFETPKLSIRVLID